MKDSQKEKRLDQRYKAKLTGILTGCKNKERKEFKRDLKIKLTAHEK